ncbi:hypothetical protein cypCar_00045957 [Cyprinus carpio]|nr:hypothetical protein cypCar_00045957 [Cyprinus carpio]
MEGDSVTLQNDVPQQRFDLIVWRFGDKGILLAKIDVETNETSLNDADERFINRLQLDQTGSVTIKNTRIKHTGFYELQIRGRESSQRFLLSVTVGIAAALLLILAAILAVVVIHYHRKISELEKQRAVTPEEKLVEDGSSVTLKADTKLQKDDEIQWWYEEDNSLIAGIIGFTPKLHAGADGRFRSKLMLDNDTGDLTINNIMLNHSGLYKLKISGKNRRTEYKRFFLSVIMSKVPAMVGGSVTLNTNINTEIQSDDLILWTFGAENCFVTKDDSGRTSCSKRFRDRLKLDEKTGSLTIRDITNADFGVYKLQIINSEKTTFKRFDVTVTDSPRNRVNESNGSTVVKLPLNRDDVNEVEEQQGTGLV